jgi:hypothetical protein
MFKLRGVCYPQPPATGRGCYPEPKDMDGCYESDPLRALLGVLSKPRQPRPAEAPSRGGRARRTRLI